MDFLAEVKVRFKKSVLEPQGKAIRMSLEENGIIIPEARVGKLIELRVSADSLSGAESLVRKITEDLLYNPVMETAEISVRTEE